MRVRFDLTREDTGHCTFQRQWVEKLIELSNFTRADEVTLQYLEYLSGDDTSIDFIKNRIKFWADPLAKAWRKIAQVQRILPRKLPGGESDGPSSSQVPVG